VGPPKHYKGTFALLILALYAIESRNPTDAKLLNYIPTVIMARKTTLPHSSPRSKPPTKYSLIRKSELGMIHTKGPFLEASTAQKKVVVVVQAMATTSNLLRVKMYYVSWAHSMGAK
jgi:hypothetical protein